MRKPEEQKKFYSALNEQRTFLRCTMMQLFGDIESLSQEQREALSSDDDDLSSLWMDESLKEDVRKKLGPTYELFKDNVEEMVDALAQLLGKSTLFGSQVSVVPPHLLRIDEASERPVEYCFQADKPTGSQENLQKLLDDTKKPAWDINEVKQRIKFR